MFDRTATGLLILGLVFAVPVNARLDDPTRPPGYRLYVPGGKSTAPSWHVDTIKIGERQRIAVINGKRVREGDSVHGARVLAIQPGYVQLRYKQEEFVIRLVPGGIRKQFR
ncbi:general secretion pathway protein GspB [Thiohalophilus sp.]|uniref:general secretion pathway protein GspB n=1 Tax=Thiohalophilus sp. TaxID=3028392 RepID=UPI003975FBDA